VFAGRRLVAISGSSSLRVCRRTPHVSGDAKLVGRKASVSVEVHSELPWLSTWSTLTLGLAIEVAWSTGMRFIAAVPTAAPESTGPTLSLGDTYCYFAFIAVG